MIPDITISIPKAQRTAGKETPFLHIKTEKEFGKYETLGESREQHQKQARRLCDALLLTLPGGTVDALLAELMKRRACLLSVSLL